MLKILNYLKFQDLNEIDKLPKNSHFKYNYLLGMAMMYMMFMLFSSLTVYKIIHISFFIAPLGVLLSPIIYCLSNVTTEVYGYQVGRNMMWWFIATSAVYTLLSSLLTQIPSPIDFKHQEAFELIFQPMPKIFIAGIIGTICGITINNYVVSKLKIWMNGKRYWLRSLASTAGGEIVYNTIAYPIMFFSHMPVNQIIRIFVCVTLFKISMTIVCLPLECLLARFLKIKEKINIFDYGITYNIFKLKFYPLEQNSNLTLVK